MNRIDNLLNKGVVCIDYYTVSTLYVCERARSLSYHCSGHIRYDATLYRETQTRDECCAKKNGIFVAWHVQSHQMHTYMSYAEYVRRHVYFAIALGAVGRRRRQRR